MGPIPMYSALITSMVYRKSTFRRGSHTCFCTDYMRTWRRIICRWVQLIHSLFQHVSHLCITQISTLSLCKCVNNKKNFPDPNECK
jgi:hypothetical protein